MAQRTKKTRSCQVKSTRETLQASPGLPFQELLSRERIAAVLVAAEIEFRERVYSPCTTLWAFLSQVMGATHGSCEDAVSRVAADRAARGRGAISPETSSYCAARKRLPEAVLRQLTLDTGSELHREAEEPWLWHGRRVILADGTTVTLADTPANQAAYPQSSGQKPGLGFPIVRLVVLLSLAVGTVLECGLAACRGKGTGELTLFRQLWNVLVSGDIVVADRLYDSYRDIFFLRARGVDCLFGIKASRKSDFRRGRRLGHDDHVVVWHKKSYYAARYESREEWESLPDTLEMREVRRIVRRPGYRPRKVTVVTTLLDAELYPACEVVGLFAQRWHCELDLRALKRSLGMHHLRCETPEMIRKELWTYLLGYNLIRVRMAQAAAVHDRLPRTLSFKGAQTQIEHFTVRMEAAPNDIARARIERALLVAIARCRVGHRPGRKEPRVLKRRLQKYPPLTKPRAQARQGLAA